MSEDQDNQTCFNCGSVHLDTGWECNDCGYDNQAHYTKPPEPITHKAPAFIVRHRGYDEEFGSPDKAQARIHELTRLYPGEFIDAFQHCGAFRWRAPETPDADA